MYTKKFQKRVIQQLVYYIVLSSRIRVTDQYFNPRKDACLFLLIMIDTNTM